MKFKRIISIITIVVFLSTLSPAPGAFALRPTSEGNGVGEVVRALGVPAAASAMGTTPLYEWHKQHAKKIVDFGGWLLPIQFADSPNDEHMAVRHAAGLFDIGHMGVLQIRGPHAIELLQRVTTNDVSKLGVGQAQYSYICDENGDILDDIIVYRFENHYMLVVNAANTVEIKEWLNAQNKERCPIDDMRQEPQGNTRKVMLALQGPKAIKVLQALTDTDLSQMRYFTTQQVVLRGVPGKRKDLDGIKVIVSRTGYTGERGYEIFVHPDQAVELWERLLEAGKGEGIMPCGLAARDSLRLEAGLPLYGHELAGPQNISPFEAGFGDFVDFNKGDFIGRDALLAKKAQTHRQVATLLLTGREEGVLDLAVKGIPIPNPGTSEVFAKSPDGVWVKIGEITSRAVQSPAWRKEGFADVVTLTVSCIEAEFALPGTQLKIVTRGREYMAVVLPHNFYSNAGDRFAREYEEDYIPITDEENAEMLKEIGVDSVDDLFQAAVPGDLMFSGRMNLPERLNRLELFLHLWELARKNRPLTDTASFLGAGMYQRNIPAVVDEASSQRAVYTPYTPYQPEMMQGNLEAIYLFQSLICKLTGMDVANASMYEGGSALAEAALMSYRITSKKSKADRKKIIVAGAVNPFHKEVLDTYAGDAGLEISAAPIDPDTGRVHLEALDVLIDENTACVIVQQPNFFGCLETDINTISGITHSRGALLVVSVDLMSLSNLRPPSTYNADIVVGEGQSFGNRLNFGGPGLGVMATRQEFTREMPGRIVGKTSDKQGRPGYVLALGTREQHIRREKATSNICSNEALCAFNAASYLMAVAYDGGLQRRGWDSHVLAQDAAEHIEAIPGFGVIFPSAVYSEFVMVSAIPIDELNRLLRAEGVIGGLDVSGVIPGGNYCLLSFTDATAPEDVGKLLRALGNISQAKELKPIKPGQARRQIGEIEQKEKRDDDLADAIPGLSASRHRAYFRWLASLNFSIDDGLYPLGSCSMKYNPKINEDIAMLPAFTNLHPRQPVEDA